MNDNLICLNRYLLSMVLVIAIWNYT